MTNVINRAPRLDDDADLAKAKKWRNRFFFKGGRSCWGRTQSFNSEAEANEIGMNSLARARETPMNLFHFADGFSAFGYQHLTFITLPIGGDQ